MAVAAGAGEGVDVNKAVAGTVVERGVAEATGMAVVGLPEQAARNIKTTIQMLRQFMKIFITYISFGVL